jgi:hypothetical protein
LRVKRYFGQQFTGRRLAHRPRVAGIGAPPGGAARHVVSVGDAQLGERGTIVDAGVGAQRAQIPLPGVDLDRIYGPAPAT